MGGLYMITLQDLEKMRLINPLTVNSDELTEIGGLEINTELLKEERIMDYITQIQNPYLCKCGNLVIQSEFTETDITLNDRLKQLFRMV
jgi:flagellar biosynthesis/type III secretory pathway protein FliH